MKVDSTNRTSDYLPWDTMLTLIRRLYRDGDVRMSLLIGCGSFFGLRVSDLRTLTWRMIMSESGAFAVCETKTGKVRTVRVSSDFASHIRKCHDALGIVDDDSHCFCSRQSEMMSVRQINNRLKAIQKKYGLKIGHFSSHSMRKTFGRKIFEASGQHAETALVMLQEMFNHSSVSVTKRYLGIRQDEIMGLYDLLDM